MGSYVYLLGDSGLGTEFLLNLIWTSGFVHQIPGTMSDSSAFSGKCDYAWSRGNLKDGRIKIKTKYDQERKNRRDFCGGQWISNKKNGNR